MKFAFPTDEHIPYQDDRARNLALKIVSDFNPDLMIAGSDGLDFYGISNFDKNPERIKLNLQYEIELWKAGQLEWRDAAPNAEAYFLMGNHEDRLRRYLWRHPEIAELEVMKLPNILDLASLGIRFENDGDEIDLGEIIIKHGRYVRKHSAISVRAEMEGEHFASSILMGHTHRGGTFYATSRNGVVEGHECFCLCSLNPDYVRRPNWQQGIVVGEIFTGYAVIEPIVFRDVGPGKIAVWRGKEYSE